MICCQTNLSVTLQPVRFKVTGAVSDEHKSRYLDLIASGVEPARAARAIGRTGSFMRRVRTEGCHHYDKDFSESFAAAYEIYEALYNERLAKELRERLFDRDDPASARLLAMEVQARLPQYVHKREKQLKIGQDTPFQIQAVIPTVSQEVLDKMPIDELEALVEKLRYLESQSRPEGLRAIEGGGG